MANADTNVLARRALLDVLEALGSQRVAAILCGAQAIYLHTVGRDVSGPPFTRDADILIDTQVLLAVPALGDAMEVVFQRGKQPGIWLTRDGIEVDLLVAEALGGPGRRGARLGEPHGADVARKVRGLEAALIDNGKMVISSLEPGDTREFECAVAGLAALLVAKLHKVGERADQDLTRLIDKDASDILKILRVASTEALGRSIRSLLGEPLAAETTKEAIEYMERDFSSEDGTGAQMAARARQLTENPATVAASCASLAGDLLIAVRV